MCWTRKREKSSSSFTTFWSKFAVAELPPKLVNFLCAGCTYPLCFEVHFCLLISFSPPCATLKSLRHTVHKAKPPLSGVSEWILHNIYFSLRRLFLNCPPSFLRCFAFFLRRQFYLVIMGKSGLNGSKIRCRLEGIDIQQKIWKLSDILRFKHRICFNECHFENFSECI